MIPAALENKYCISLIILDHTWPNFSFNENKSIRLCMITEQSPGEK